MIVESETTEHVERNLILYAAVDWSKHVSSEDLKPFNMYNNMEVVKPQSNILINLWKLFKCLI